MKERRTAYVRQIAAPRQVQLLLILLLNLALAAAYLWSRGEATPVTVTVESNQLVARVSNLTLPVTKPAPLTGQVGLFLGPPESFQYAGWTSERPSVVPFDLPILAALWWEGDWSPTTVTQPQQAPRMFSWQGDVVEGDEAARYLDRRGVITSPGTVAHLFNAPPSPPFQVRTSLIRGRNGGGVIVGAENGAGYVFTFRPTHHDASWWAITLDGWSGPLANGVFERPAQSIIQELVSLLLRGYPAAVALLLASLLAGLAGRRLASPTDPTATKSVARSTERASPVTPSPGRPARDRPLQMGKAPTLAQEEESRGQGRSDRPTLSGFSIVLALSTGTLITTALVATVLLEGIPHVQDSVGYLFQAKLFANGRLWAPVPNLPEFFEHEFVLMYDERWFSIYPPGWPALLALGVLVGHPELVNPLLAAGTLALVYLLGKELYGQSIGLLAAVLGFSSPFFIFMSGSMMSHSSGLFFATLFLLAFARTQRGGSGWASVAAGCAFGMTFLIRPWTAIVFSTAVVLFELPAVLREPARLRRWLPAVFAALSFVGVWMGYQAAVTGNPLQNPTELWWPFARVGYGPDHGPRGFWPIDGIENTNRNLGELLRHLYGWPPALTLAFVLVPFIALRARRADAQLATAFLGIVAGYAVWWADGIMYGPRFYYEGLATLLLLTARGVSEVISVGREFQSSQKLLLPGLGMRPENAHNADKWVAQSSGSLITLGIAFKRPLKLDPSRWLTTAIVALLIAGNFLVYFPAQWQIHFGYNYVNRQAVNTVEAADIGRAVVFVPVGEWYAWWNYGSVFSANSPFLDTQVVYARDLGDAKNQRLITAMSDRASYRLVNGQVKPYRGASR